MKAEDKNTLLDHAHVEADAMYRQVVTVATAFLAASLYVMHKLGPLHPSWAIVPMALGGLFLVGAIFLTLWVRWNNVESMRLLAEDKWERATSRDALNRGLTWASLGSVTLGILLMATAILIFVSWPKPKIGGPQEETPASRSSTASATVLLPRTGERT